jgi:small subunit ribosomal protein S10
MATTITTVIERERSLSDETRFGLQTVERMQPLSDLQRVLVGKKFRLVVKAYEPAILDRNCAKIINVIKENRGNFVGPVPLPTKLRRYCVLTSPHVNKKARDHFEIRTHRRIIDLPEPDCVTIANLKKLDISAGVFICVKILKLNKHVK